YKEITYKDGMIEVAPLPLLIYRLVPTSTYYPDKSYIFAFLLNSRVFLTPHQLFQQVCEACKQQESLLDKQNIVSGLLFLLILLLLLLLLWTDNFAYDFRDERMIILLKEMNSLILKHHLHFKKEITIITQNLYSKLQALHKYEDLLDKINMEVSSRTNNLLPTVSLSTDITETCPNPLFLGHQLTHIELERLSMIGPEEFIQDHALRSVRSDWLLLFRRFLKKLTNIDSYVHWYNRLSYFVATEICMHLKKKNRARMIEYFVDVAKECINIGNFNSLMAILGGLNMPAIQRLKKTWAKVNKEKFEILERLSNPCGNFNSYRSSLKAALWRSEGASDDRERIIVPFFSVMLKDIYMLNENKDLPDRFSNGHVNFKKIWEVTKVVNEFMAWKQVE
ncbi:hypothetical protein HELRODRAFT_140568, partial [Helobdella robusta]|uniref:Ras-GEF domain-containing protein n=1 Tax=Helobdella robusta TaxID=6412 RepID=T1EJ15_HELRO